MRLPRALRCFVRLCALIAVGTVRERGARKEYGGCDDRKRSSHLHSGFGTLMPWSIVYGGLQLLASGRLFGRCCFCAEAAAAADESSLDSSIVTGVVSVGVGVVVGVGTGVGAGTGAGGSVGSDATGVGGGCSMTTGAGGVRYV